MPNLLNSTLGEYRLVDFLGAGGMGEVYRGVHVRIGRVVAIKVLLGGMDTNTVQRFLNEARIQATLRHPGIAVLYDFLETQGRPAIIMEYVEGHTVAERIAAKGPLSVVDAASVIASVADTIGYVHSQGIIHRDLKTGNIKINPAGEVKLLDFGIAKGPDAAKLTKTRSVVGTFQNLSPEQLEGQAATFASDIWALGVVLYEMVTGRPPFDSENPTELMVKIIKVEYPPASAVNPAVPRELDQVIGHCLKKRPADRYHSAADLRRPCCRSPPPASTAPCHNRSIRRNGDSARRSGRS